MHDWKTLPELLHLDVTCSAQDICDLLQKKAAAVLAAFDAGQLSTRSFWGAEGFLCPSFVMLSILRPPTAGQSFPNLVFAVCMKGIANLAQKPAACGWQAGRLRLSTSSGRTSTLVIWSCFQISKRVAPFAPVDRNALNKLSWSCNFCSFARHMMVIWSEPSAPRPCARGSSTILVEERPTMDIVAAWWGQLC